MAPANRYVGWLTRGYNGYLCVGLLIFVVVLILTPFETTVVPAWRLRVVDVNGTPCPNMRVQSTWQHYSLELEPMAHGDTRFTDSSGYVGFPRRPISASLARRLVNTTFAHLMTIAHGSVGPSGIVWASGIKGEVWLDYKRDKPLPDKMLVERCLAGDGT